MLAAVALALATTSAGHRLRGVDRDPVTSTERLDRADSTTPSPCLTASSRAATVIERVGRLDTERAPDGVAIEGADEAGAFERAPEHRLERADRRPGRSVRLVRSAITTDTGSCWTGGRVDHQTTPERARSSKPAATATGRPDDALRIGRSLPVVVEPVERRDQFAARLEPLRGVGLDAARHQAIERRPESTGRSTAPTAARCSSRCLQVGDRARRVVRRAAAREHVVQDQSERVDVGSLIDVLAPRLLGRHVLDGADHGAHDGRRGRVIGFVRGRRDRELFAGRRRAGSASRSRR